MQQVLGLCWTGFYFRAKLEQSRLHVLSLPVRFIMFFFLQVYLQVWKGLERSGKSWSWFSSHVKFGNGTKVSLIIQSDAFIKSHLVSHYSDSLHCFTSHIKGLTFSLKWDFSVSVNFHISPFNHLEVHLQQSTNQSEATEQVFINTLLYECSSQRVHIF